MTAYSEDFPRQESKPSVSYTGAASIVGGKIGEPRILGQQYIPDSEAESDEFPSALAEEAEEEDEAAFDAQSADDAEKPGLTGAEADKFSLWKYLDSLVQVMNARNDGVEGGKAGRKLNEHYSSSESLNKISMRMYSSKALPV